MKIFVKRRIGFLLAFLLFLTALQMLLVFLTLDPSRNFAEVRNEALMIMLIFFLLQFAITVLVIAQLPYYLKKYLSSIEDIISSISGGNYNFEIDLEEKMEQRDKEVVDVIDSIKKAMDVIIRFDSLKRLKIQEQRARIISLLNLTENGFIIINRKGDVVYINYLISEYFHTIKENVNIVETSFSLEIDRNIQSYISAIIRNKEKLMPKNFYMSTLKRHITLKSEIIRDANGDFDGTVIGIYNLLKDNKAEKADKEPEETK